MTDKAKHYLHCYGFFTVVVLLMFIILFLTVFFTKNVPGKKIKPLLQEKIESIYPETYVVAEEIDIAKPMTVSSVAYKIENKNKETGFAVVLRMTGISGPVAGVFILKPENPIPMFIGTIGNEHSQKSTHKWDRISRQEIDYWEKQISIMLEGYLQ